MPEPVPRWARNFILWFWALTLIAWVLVYLFVMAPRQARPWYMHAVILIGGVALTAGVFLNPLRGVSIADTSERQQYWHVGSKFWEAVAFVVLAPISMTLAVIVVAAMVVGSFLYVHLIRGK